MKLRNKKTGEIVEPFGITCINGRTFVQFDNCKGTFKFEANSLTELNKEWEDYEEPKTEFYITAWGDIREYTTKEERFAFKQKLEIGNYFETKEEAEKAVEKLKALKRLKDEGFRFRWIDMQTGQIKYGLFLEKGQKFTRGDEDDLLLLFGGEE